MPRKEQQLNSNIMKLCYIAFYEPCRKIGSLEAKVKKVVQNSQTSRDLSKHSDKKTEMRYTEKLQLLCVCVQVSTCNKFPCGEKSQGPEHSLE